MDVRLSEACMKCSHSIFRDAKVLGSVTENNLIIKNQTKYSIKGLYPKTDECTKSPKVPYTGLC